MLLFYWLWCILFTKCENLVNCRIQYQKDVQNWWCIACGSPVDSQSCKGPFLTLRTIANGYQFTVRKSCLRYMQIASTLVMFCNTTTGWTWTKIILKCRFSVCGPYTSQGITTVSPILFGATAPLTSWKNTVLSGMACGIRKVFEWPSVRHRNWVTVIKSNFSSCWKRYYLACGLLIEGALYWCNLFKNAVFLCKAAKLVKFLAKGGGIKKLRKHIFSLFNEQNRLTHFLYLYFWLLLLGTNIPD